MRDIDSTVEAFFLWQKCPILDISRDSSLDFQKKVLSLTLDSALYRNFPIPFSKARRFFKTLILDLEKVEDSEVLPEFYNFVLSGEPQESREGYRTFLSSSFREPVSLLEDVNLFSAGTTGLRTWPAALALVQYFITENPISMGGKSVLELGSGTGYCGIALAKSASPKSVILTDYHPEVLRVLSLNVKNNGVSAEVKKLDWAEKESGIIPSSDTIIASDVVYDPSILSHLSMTIKHFMKTEAFISCTERNIGTLRAFELELEKNELSWEVVRVIDNQRSINESDPQLPIRIYSIRKRENGDNKSGEAN